MARPQDIEARTPGTNFDPDDLDCQYWLNEGAVWFRYRPIRGADPATFRYFRGYFGKDARRCYVGGRALRDADPTTFRALSLAYFTDGQTVWAGTRLRDADAATFVACDDGVHFHGRFELPHGFGKDAARVFYYDCGEKAVWVRKADSASFVSCNDGFFGKDNAHAFCRYASIPKADVRTWRTLGQLYSRDDRRIFYGNQELRDADPATFEVFQHDLPYLARDGQHLYRSGQSISREKWEKLLEDWERLVRENIERGMGNAARRVNPPAGTPSTVNGAGG